MSGQTTSVPHGSLFDVAAAAAKLRPALRLVEMRSFLGLNLPPARLLLPAARTRFSNVSYAYLDALGLSRWRAAAGPLSLHPSRTRLCRQRAPAASAQATPPDQLQAQLHARQ